MKVCVLGAGAIGGYIGAKLALAGEEVTLVARGAHLQAMQKSGLTLIEDGKPQTVHPHLSPDARDLPPQDVVFLTVKAHSLTSVIEYAERLLDNPRPPILVPAINGLPWWYFYKLEGPYTDRRIESVDPGGVLWNKLPPERVVGCIVYPACDLIEPGVIQHIYSNRFDLGEPDGSKSERAQALSKMMIKAGLRAPLRTNIRDNLWVKLWGNISFNMICALTLSSLDQVIADAGTKALARRMMLEAQEVATRIGVKFPIDVDARIAGASEVGVHKPSTLIDLERSRPLEIDPILGAVVELGKWTGVPMPACESVLPLIRLRAKRASLYTDPT